MDETVVARTIIGLEQDLNHFDLAVRSRALEELVQFSDQGVVPVEPEADVANMHCHTFFSFNAYGFSPTALAWQAKRRGYKLIGIVDFDVLDGVDEFFEACTAVGLRGSAGIETRVHVPEFARYEINSPGEPGVCYHMGIGFASSLVPVAVVDILDDMQLRARNRNREMLERINTHLHPVTIDYQRDVVPLTPAGTATERHMVAAQLRVVGEAVSDQQSFWADRLGVDRGLLSGFWDDSPRLQNLIRAKLMKRGGVAYVQPGPGTFPTVEEFHQLVLACGALPCAAWLDGTSAGEKRIEDLLAHLIEKGVVAINIVPDRNWNVADPDLKRIKLRNLDQIVDLASQLALPINVGTEMNSFGQPLVDNFDAPELAEIRSVFMDGAHFVYGHTALHRVCGMGYQSTWAQQRLPRRDARNTFYTRVGRIVSPGRKGLTQLQVVREEMTPADVITAIMGKQDAVEGTDD